MSIYTIVIHGGAGTILKKDMTAEKETAYNAALDAALDAGYALLEKGSSATDAVRAAVCSLEDNILFNAGKFYQHRFIKHTGHAGIRFAKNTFTYFNFRQIFVGCYGQYDRMAGQSV